MGFPGNYFRAQVYTIKLHGAFGVGLLPARLATGGSHLARALMQLHTALSVLSRPSSSLLPRSPGTHIVGPWAIDNLSRDSRTGTQYIGNWASRVFLLCQSSIAACI